eukprot:g6478.t1
MLLPKSVERNGSGFWSIATACRLWRWRTGRYTFRHTELFRSSGVPTCPRCGEAALPAVLLLDEEGPLDTDLYKDFGRASNLRQKAEALAGGVANCDVRLLRVHRCFPSLPKRLERRACGLRLHCAEALKRIEALMSVLEMGSFLCQE